MRTLIECILRPIPIIEKWKDVVGFEGYYQVSNIGRVKSVPRKVNNHTGYLTTKEKILTQSLSKKGYPVVYLSKNAKMKTCVVHRLVAKAFIPNPYELPQVNHIDGIKTNNDICNLEWCNNDDNRKHAYMMGLMAYGKGSKKTREYIKSHKGLPSGKPKRKVVKIDVKTNEPLQVYSSIREAADDVGLIISSNIGECCRGKKKTIKGYKWKYYEEVM